MNSIIFVHGICSTVSSIFTPMMDELRKDTVFNTDWEFVPFDYDWRRAIAVSASELRAKLRSLYRARSSGGRALIVAHSMGGLVSRLALLGAEDDLGINRVIMLASPNLGALTTAQLGILSQPFLAVSSGLLLGQYLRKPGVRDLTRVYELFKPYSQSDKTTDIEYVTIPGTFFHANRPFWQKAESGDQRMFSRLAIASELITAMSSMVRISMDRPHDGIVEERSVRLLPIEPGKWNEKRRSVRSTKPETKTYAHVIHNICDELTHTELCKHGKIIALVRELILAHTLPDWLSDLDDGHHEAILTKT